MASVLPGSPRVLEQTHIRPAPGTGTGTATEPLPLTQYDVLWLSLHHVQRVLMYPFPHPTSDFLAHHLPALKSSLSLTLRTFFPLAGRVHPSPDGHTLQIRCVQGQDSVPITVAESDDDFHHLCSDHPRHSTRVAALIPFLPRVDASCTAPLLAVQATVFPRSGGLSIGFTYNHMVCDGTSFVHFVRSWAAANKLNDATPPTTMPCYDRALVPDTGGLCSRYFDAMPLPPPDQAGPTLEPQDVLFASFTLSHDHIAGLKRKALARAAARPFHCSAFAVTLAHTWACLFKAEGRARERAHALFAADYRRRLTPPLPTEYFGNCLGEVHVEMSMSDLLGDDGFAAAAEAIGRALDGLAAGGGSSVPAIGMEEIMSIYTRERPIGVAGSPRAGVYSVDFGWGRPVKVDVTSIRDSAISIAESRDAAGGIEIGVALPELQMEQFRSHFYDGLKLLLL